MSASSPCGVVLDTGSCFTKVGYSGEEVPRSIFHSCVGETRPDGVDASLLQYTSDIVAGDAAYASRGLFHLRHPIQHGEVVDTHTFEQLLFYTLYNRMRVPPEGSTLLMLEPVRVSRKQRETVAEIMFESLNVPMLALLNTSSATLYSTGQTTGVVIDSGAGKTMINAVTDGYPLAFAMHLSHLAGDYLTDRLFTRLRARGYPFSTRNDWQLAEQIKEHRCRAALDFAQEVSVLAGGESLPDSNAYELPDDERVFLFENEVAIAECLFDVEVARGTSEFDAKQERASDAVVSCGGKGGSDVAMRAIDTVLQPVDFTGYGASNPSCRTLLYGWAEAVGAVVSACPAHLHSGLFGSVVLGGGTTLMHRVDKRLQQELVRVVTQRPTSRSVWQRGGYTTDEVDGRDGRRVWGSASTPHARPRTLETSTTPPSSYASAADSTTAAGSPMAVEYPAIRVLAYAERGYAAWLGGSIWSSMGVYPQSGMSVAEYHERGPHAVHKYAM